METAGLGLWIFILAWYTLLCMDQTEFVVVWTCVDKVLLNQTWVYLPRGNKAHLQTQGCGEAKSSVYCRPQSKGSRYLVLKSLENPNEFQGEVLKHKVKEGRCRVCDQLCRHSSNW